MARATIYQQLHYMRHLKNIGVFEKGLPQIDPTLLQVNNNSSKIPEIKKQKQEQPE